MIAVNINGNDYNIDVDPSMPILWVLREQIKLQGTKFGCGIAQCGACTIHLDGEPIRSCLTPIGSAAGKSIITIEGLGDTDNLHILQKVWIEEQVPQCGYCQSGQIMSAAALLEKNSNPTDEEIEEAMNGNICRCGTYSRIKTAIKKASNEINSLALQINTNE